MKQIKLNIDKEANSIKVEPVKDCITVRDLFDEVRDEQLDWKAFFPIPFGFTVKLNGVAYDGISFIKVDEEGGVCPVWARCDDGHKLVIAVPPEYYKNRGLEIPKQ
jgi:hypothetical protein